MTNWMNETMEILPQKSIVLIKETEMHGIYFGQLENGLHLILSDGNFLELTRSAFCKR